MNCPNCDSVLIEGLIDNRQEWNKIYYHCQTCQKSYLRTVTFKTQSSLVESDELKEITEKEL